MKDGEIGNKMRSYDCPREPPDEFPKKHRQERLAP